MYSICFVHRCLEADWRNRSLLTLMFNCFQVTVPHGYSWQSIFFITCLLTYLSEARSKDRPKFWIWGEIPHSSTHKCYFSVYFSDSPLFENIWFLAECVEHWDLGTQKCARRPDFNSQNPAGTEADWCPQFSLWKNFRPLLLLEYGACRLR